MIESDLDDTHLCIKCSSTIVGLDNYIEHRKRNCASTSSSIVNPNSTTHKIPTTTAASNRRTSHEVPATIISTATANLDHTYEAFPFPEPEPPTTYVNKSEHGGKTSKSLTDSYDLPYELGADVFFSSLQLQSVQSTGLSTSGGKTHSSTPQIPLQRQKSSPMQQEPTEQAEVVAWNVPIHASSASGQQNTDTLMKAVSDMSDVKKPYEVFKPITFEHESPDASEDEEPEDEHDAEMDDDDEDYDPIAASHATGGKWKPTPMPHSPPVVPVTHTGGKWKPENRPNLRVTHTQLSCLSPNWDEQLDEAEVLDTNAEQHPPAEHTKGKWVPGTKMQRLEYKEEVVELAKSNVSHEYWCNICCRKLKSKAIYESHLRTSYHLKRAETEQQLEKAALSELQRVDITKTFVLEAPKVVNELRADGKRKRKRSATFIKCHLCKHVMLRHLVGKHLISHYHYRRMQMNPGQSLHMILDNIHSIVLQSPFQCRPCRFYANTEETFLQHWNSPEHLDLSEGPGKFWCSYCNFECEDNNQMRRHLLSWDHKEVILAINRSVPICISKKLAVECTKCRQSFRYNIELRKHMQLCHAGIQDTSTASDTYQSRFNCNLCPDSFPSCVALQRHEKNRHSITKYFCSICKQQFGSACQARRHRKTLAHRICAASAEKRISIKKQKSLQTKGVKNSRECNKCGFMATSEVEAMLHELSHSKSDFASSSTAGASAKASTSKKSAETTPRKVQAPIAKPETPIKCKDCIVVCKSVVALKLHRDSEHPLLSHVCMSCGQSFARAQALGQHSRVCKPTTTAKVSEDSTAAKSWNCEQCGFRATYESELIFHRLFHIHGPMTKNQLIQCPLCTKEFRKDSLRCHLRLHTNEKIFECQFCNLKFSRRHNLTEHTNKTHKKREETKEKAAAEKQKATTTATAEKPTTSKAAAVAAAAAASKTPDVAAVKKAATKKPKGNYQCDTCGKVFTLKNSLKMHSLQHVEGGIDLRKYVCSYEGCDYAAATNAILSVHLASHSQEDLKCEHANCKYTGKSERHLKRHLRSHTEQSKVYTCESCDFKSSIKSHLRRHMFCHSGAKPQQCPHCDYRCSTLDNLRKHVLKTNKHTGKFIYECEQCAQQQFMETEMEIGETITIFKTNSFHEYQLHMNSSHASNKTKS